MKSTTNLITTSTTLLLVFTLLFATTTTIIATTFKELEGNFFYSINFGDSKCSPSTIQTIEGHSIIKPNNPNYPLSGSCYESTPDQYGYSQYTCDDKHANVKTLCQSGCNECFNYETHELHQCVDRTVSGCGKLPDFILHSEHFNITMLYNFQYQVHANERDNHCGRTSNDFLTSFFASRINTCLNWIDSTEMIKCNSTDYSFLKYKQATNTITQCSILETNYSGKTNTCSNSNNNVNICH